MMTNCHCLVTWVDIVQFSSTLTVRDETCNVAKQNTIKDYVSAGVNGFKLVNTLDITW
jgi:hypothetical protein